MAPVTVVVPNYNGARFLALTLRSLLAQTARPAKLILLDNCSTDESVAVAVALGDPRLQIVRTEAHVSMADNWSRALTLVDTPYALLAHADDLYDSRYVHEMVSLLDTHPRAFIAHCRVISIDETGRPYESPQESVKELFWPPTPTYERDGAKEFSILRRGNYILAPAVTFRTDVARRLGPFNSAYHFVPDWEYWLRGILQGHSIVGMREQLVAYRRHAAMGTQLHQLSLRRYHEEIALSVWAAGKGHAAGLVDAPDPDFRLVRNTILSDFSGRLARNERTAARALLDFARGAIPDFRWSVRHVVMAAALRAGRLGGFALQAIQSAYIATIHQQQRLQKNH